jgi:L-amino acid N-acyltransferase YncA
MMVDQRAAIELCKRLGFRCEAVLTKHVQDQHGQFRDLMVMTYFINDFQDASDNQTRDGAGPRARGSQ